MGWGRGWGSRSLIILVLLPTGSEERGVSAGGSRQ